jgi:hypothetical protein
MEPGHDLLMVNILPFFIGVTFCTMHNTYLVTKHGTDFHKLLFIFCACLSGCHWFENVKP